MAVDVRISNELVHTPAGPIAADVLIAGEQIVGLVTSSDTTDARQVIDACGRDILPGVVDLHAHARVPGYTHKEDYLTVSQAAAAWGITTIVDMPNVEPPTDSPDRLAEKRALAQEVSLVDWGHWAAGAKPEQVPALAAAGAIGFKIWQLHGAYPHDPRLAVSEEDKLYQCFEAIAATGLPCMVHPFNQPLFDLFSARALASGKPRNYVTYAEVYTREAIWRTAVAMLLELQRETGVRLHVAHLHSAGAIELVHRAKAAGRPVTAAIDPKYYHFTLRDLLAEDGERVAPAGYIAEDPARLAAIWNAFADGTIDIIDSDHAPHTLDELKVARTDAWKSAKGNPNYDYMLSVVLTDVAEGKMSLATAVRALSENPARLIGHFPRKGALLPGSDADLVIVDRQREIVARDEDTYTKVRWTPFRGWRLVGVPELTMLRGQVIARDRQITVEPGCGRWLAGVPQPAAAPEPARAPA